MLLHIVFFKLVSESLLSLYPLLVKRLPLSIMNQLWTRLFVYSVISLVFINWKKVFTYIFRTNGLLLALINLVHIYSSYMGFKRLDISVSYSILYIYPVFIILFARKRFYWSFLIPIIGVIFLSLNLHKKDLKKCEDHEIIKADKKKRIYQTTIGVLMMIISALTEAGIYYYVHDLDMQNPWNPLFISYFLPCIIISIFLNKRVIPKDNKKGLIYGVIGNGIIGIIGFYLRFKSIVNLTPFAYAYLSYFGIIMAYIYGIFFNNEKFSWNRIVGTLIIVLYGLFNYSSL